jgi:hypothetical protein
MEDEGNVRRMSAAIPLTDDERAAVDDGQAVLDRLLDRLAGTPTPAARHRANSTCRRPHACCRSSLSGKAVQARRRADIRSANWLGRVSQSLS